MMRLYPETGIGTVVMTNATGFDVRDLLDRIDAPLLRERSRSGEAERVQSPLLPQSPSDLARHWVSQLFCWWARLGLPPRFWVSLEVRHRVSGRMRADAVVVPTGAGEQYVVSMFGTISDRLHNIEAAHGDAVISHGGSVRVRLVLVPPEQRPPILREYVRAASSGRKHFLLPVGAPLAEFAAIAPQYPVYRIELVTA